MVRKHMLVTAYLTPHEAKILIDSCIKERDKFILQTMWETAGRISEVLGLVPENIDIISNCIYLINLKQHEKGKLKLKRIKLFHESTLCKDLTEYCSRNDISPGDWVFQGHVLKEGKEGQVSPVYIWYLLANADPGRKLGLSYENNIRKVKGDIRKPAWPHLFRHGAAMNIYRRTGRIDAVQKQLGHSSMETTEAYADLMEEDIDEIMDNAKEERK
jgi:integrase